MAGFTKALDQLNSELASGSNVVLHCRQGVGRTGPGGCLPVADKGIGRGDGGVAPDCGAGCSNTGDAGTTPMDRPLMRRHLRTRDE